MKRTILLSLTVAAIFCSSSSAAIRTVPQEYPTIQQAINVCANGDTVVVDQGTYNERIDFSGKNVVVMSTNPDDPSVVASTTIDAGGTGSAVSFQNGETPDAVITGFTITGGYGTNYMQEQGLVWGGGIFCAESSPTITKNVIMGNNCPVAEDAISYGGGISCLMSDAVITNNIIKDNTGYAGAGLMVYVGNARVTDNMIYGNSAIVGGGVVALGGRIINNTIVSNDVSLPSDLVPIEGRPGGNIYAASDPETGMYEAHVVNNIICSAASGSGLLYIGLGEGAAAFNDVWGNMPGDYMMMDPQTGEATVDGPASLTGVYGNISTDPLFVHPGNRDYHLMPDSPCISAGDPAFVPEPGQTDIDGDERVYAHLVDIGADEYVGYVRPTADAGDDIHVAEPGLITLDGSGSFFYDPCSPTTYMWEQVSGVPVVLSDEEAVKPTFVAEEYGEYRFELVVSDGEYESWPDQVIVLVGNEPPVADAGVGKVMDVPGRGTLDGSASYDPDPIDELSYSWTQLSGPSVTLEEADTAKPSFDVTEQGLYVFQLIVSDGMDDSEPSTVQVTTVSAVVDQNSVDAGSGIDGYSHYPDVSGGKVVSAFGWGMDYEWDIAVKDIDSGEVVTFAGGGVDTQPTIDGDIVVWSGGPRPGNFGWPLRTTSIYVHNLATGQHITLKSRSDSESYSHPAISGKKIVWLQHTDIDVEEEMNWRQMPYAVCGADISDFNNPAFFTIAYHVGIKDPYPIDDPSADFDDVIDISGNLVVWEGGGDIYGADISDLQRIRYLTVYYGPGRQYDPAISGRYVVWTDERDDSGDIYMADLSDLSNIGRKAVAKSVGSQQQPDIDGCVAVYVQGGVYGGEIKAVCLTKQHGPLDIELIDYPYGVGPAIKDGILVWQDSTYGFLRAMSLDVGYSISDGCVENKTKSMRYDYIQHAIKGAAEGDQIVAEEGTYCESINLLGKSVAVSSTNPSDPDVVAATVIRGAGSAITFAGEESWSCVLAGFTIEGSRRGVYSYGSSPTIVKCNIKNSSGPGIELFKASSPRILNCSITGHGDSGISMWPFKAGRQTIYNTPKISNCVIADNGGAGIFGDDPIIANCTIAGNDGGGVISRTPVVTNSILYYNGFGAPQIAGETVSVAYSDVEGGWPGEGNIDSEPLFVAWEEGDYHLLADSACINAGDPDFAGAADPVDMDGESRVKMGRVDMGADEFDPFEVELIVVNKTRVGRTVFEYECKAVLTNVSVFSVDDIQLALASASGNVSVVQPNLTFGDAELGEGDSVVSVDTCAFVVDRSEALDLAKMIWLSTCRAIKSGQRIQLEAGGAAAVQLPSSPADLFSDGIVDYIDLASLAERWLWTGSKKGPDEDIAEDGVVNFIDFAELAREWEK